MKLSPFDVVFLKENLPEAGLIKGQSGVILVYIIRPHWLMK